MHTIRSVFAILIILVPLTVAGLTTAEDLAAAYSLTVSTTLPFPTETLSSSAANSFVISSWSLNNNKVQNQPSDLTFVSDPFPSSSPSLAASFAASSSQNTTSPVIQVTYGSGSFGGGDGGVQFLSLFDGNISPQTMLLSYEVAFDKGFQFVKGGKLPGLRGGSDTSGCEGGGKPNGTDCWSTRLMWRTAGEGEAYAYIPDSNRLCSQANIICNSDFGTSVGRGSFSFIDGAWNRITLLVQLNNPGNVANGNIMLYYNDVQAIQQPNLQLRSSTNVLANGLFFSTFFGGNDGSWASPTTQHSFYRNFRIWASANPSNGTGDTVSSATSLHRTYGHGIKRGMWWIEAMCVVVVMLIYGVGAI